MVAAHSHLTIVYRVAAWRILAVSLLLVSRWAVGNNFSITALRPPLLQPAKAHSTLLARPIA